MSHNGDQASKRQAILSAAEKVFGERGFQETTMDAVAAEAGIAKGSIYNYFHSKHELFAQLHSAFVQAELDVFDGLMARPGTAMQKVERLVDAWWQRRGGYEPMSRLVLEFWAEASRQPSQGAMAETFRAFYTRWRVMMADMIRDGVASGEFRPDLDPEAMASIMIAMAEGIDVQTLMHSDIRLDESFRASLKRTILAALLAQRAGAAHS
ncbi:MAG TPA: TetR/AcrR family transcriptional regulator [Candidatus Brocadiia bacterium]|nr:TetR/AcrR family transcriptional regulator [Candidatus Brocadiia bacterium]